MAHSVWYQIKKKRKLYSKIVHYLFAFIFAVFHFSLHAYGNHTKQDKDVQQPIQDLKELYAEIDSNLQKFITDKIVSLAKAILEEEVSTLIEQMNQYLKDFNITKEQCEPFLNLQALKSFCENTNATDRNKFSSELYRIFQNAKHGISSPINGKLQDKCGKEYPLFCWFSQNSPKAHLSVRLEQKIKDIFINIHEKHRQLIELRKKFDEMYRKKNQEIIRMQDRALNSDSDDSQTQKNYIEILDLADKFHEKYKAIIKVLEASFYRKNLTSAENFLAEDLVRMYKLIKIMEKI